VLREQQVLTAWNGGFVFSEKGVYRTVSETSPHRLLVTKQDALSVRYVLVLLMV
jgi:hypothetical protein